MRRVVTAAEVEAAASSGASIVVDDTTLVTPLARDRAAVLGVSLGGDPVPSGPAEPAGSAPTSSGPDIERLILESRVRTVARRTLLAHGRDLSGLEELVEAVMTKLGCGCDCECGSGR